MPKYLETDPLVKPTKVALSSFTVGVESLKEVATATSACKANAAKSCSRYILSEIKEYKIREEKKIMYGKKPSILLSPFLKGRCPVILYHLNQFGTLCDM